MRTTGLMTSGTTGGTARSMMIRGLMTAGLTTATMTVIILLIRTMTILSGDDWSSGDEITTPPDPDPLPDPGDAPTDSGGEQEGIGGGNGETNNNEEGGENPLPDVKIPYSTSSYPGYVPGERDCKQVADIIMHQISRK